MIFKFSLTDNCDINLVKKHLQQNLSSLCALQLRVPPRWIINNIGFLIIYVAVTNLCKVYLYLIGAEVKVTA